MDVQPFVADVTAGMDLSGSNLISYKALFRGENYVLKKSTTPAQGGFEPLIEMSSYLVFWE